MLASCVCDDLREERATYDATAQQKNAVLPLATHFYFFSWLFYNLDSSRRELSKLISFLLTPDA